MDWYPLWNSLRIALAATVIVFFMGICTAYYISRLPHKFKGLLDVLLTLPLVLPPTVIGYLLLCLFGPHRPLGIWIAELGGHIVMHWHGAVLASAAVSFPLMYRTARGAFEAFDPSLRYAAQTLGLSNTYIFWRITMPCCKAGLSAGTVLTFARALGEYGATSMISGYIPGKTATVSTTVYQLWRIGDNRGAVCWVAVNILISTIVLVSVNLFENVHKTQSRR